MAESKNQNRLLQLIREQSFALYDIGMFLDTHPTDAEALSCFRKFRDLLEETKMQYNEMYGPLTIKEAAGETCWTWVQMPWPWERQA